MPDASLEFLAPAGFEWDEDKSKANRQKHGIDFEDATRIFYGPVLLRRSARNDEERWIAIGSLENKLIAVVFTRRAEVIRIISSRRARKNEERTYRHTQLGRPPQGQD
ncbi:MAG: BrnT family toxin [Bradyrhizobium sp.]|uniref:BrnT family toxin n=1 Tax=Bradyrhizobium sp. TaxID=376 RepID=UPI001D5A92BD|nr:BrnT family toxin [Bradyrhizobium sp.]MBV9560835.1 BrnT family toxin [Bradyrhizobium sp.]